MDPVHYPVSVYYSRVLLLVSRYKETKPSLTNALRLTLEEGFSNDGGEVNIKFLLTVKVKL